MKSAMLAAMPLVGALGALTIVSGCARPYGVPPFTQLVAEAPGQAAAFQAPDEGTVWVDGPGKFDRHIVYSGLVHRGDMIAVDPASRSLTLDGKPVDVSIADGRSAFYQIWYQPVRHDLLAP